MKIPNKYTKTILEFKKLIEIMQRLRGPNGCPWDKRQNHKSLLPYLFEEADEFKLAVKNKDLENMKEELGDVLLQVMFHSQIANENRHFSIADVISEINRKLIRRHPHVFGKNKLSNPQQVIKQWNKIKELEKQNSKRSQNTESRIQKNGKFYKKQ